MHVIDLSIPVRDGEGRLGLEVRFETPYRFEDCGWQGSTVSMFCHYATHVDAPNHFIEGGSGIDEAPLAKLMGPAGLIELSDHGANAGIRGDTLEDRGKHLRPGDIAILRTGWSDRCWGEPAFWSEGPYLCADGAKWLVERGVNAVVYDFCEEEIVRGGTFRGEDCVRPPHPPRRGHLQHRVRAPAARDHRRAARHRRPPGQARRTRRGPRPGARHRGLRPSPGVRDHRLRRGHRREKRGQSEISGSRERIRNLTLTPFFRSAPPEARAV